MSGLRLVIVHDDPRATLALKRVIEAEVDAEVLGAGGYEAALRRVEDDAPDALLMHWPLPEGEAYELLWRLSERGAHPPVLAFGGHWDVDDIRRVLQLGVIGVLDAPLECRALLADLESLGGGAACASVRRLLGVHGPWLLQADDTLWATEALGTWQLRMADLAVQVRKRWLATLAKRADALCARLEASTHAHLTAPMAKALVGVIIGGEGQLEAMSRLYQLDERLLRRLLRRARSFGESLGGEAELAETMKHLVARLSAREQRARSGALVALQRASRLALKRDDPAAAHVLLEGLHHLLHVAQSVVDGIPPETVRRLAARLLLEEDEAGALERCRLVLLGHLLPPGREAPATKEEAKAFAALFGARRLSATALVERLCALNPDPVLRRIDLLALRHFAPELSESAHGTALTLLAAGRLGGTIDRRRVDALLAAIDAHATVLVGPPTWRSVEVLLAEPDRRAAVDTVQRVLFATGARGSADVPVLRDTMHAMLERVPEALDLVRFLTACHDAIAGHLDLGAFVGLGAQPTGDAMMLERLGGRAFEESRIRAVLDEFAGLREALPQVDLATAVRRMPQTAAAHGGRLTGGEVLRLQVLASLLAHQRTDEARVEILRVSHSPDARPRGEEAVALEAMARELGDPHTTALIRRRLGLEAKPDLEVVRSALEDKKVDAAFIAVQALRDDTEALPELLCAVALSLYELGRGPEGAPLYRRALAIEPGRLNALFALARIEVEATHFDAALPLALEVCRVAPQLTPGKNLLAEVQAGLVRP